MKTPVDFLPAFFVCTVFSTFKENFLSPMVKQIFTWLSLFLLLLLLLASALLLYGWQIWEKTLSNTNFDTYPKSKLSGYYETPLPSKGEFTEVTDSLPVLPNEEITIEEFLQPNKTYCPWTRWWLPGNDLDTLELKREIFSFAKNNFGGVEIQCFTQGLDKKAAQSEMKRRLSFDSENYHQNLHFLLRQAQLAGLEVDLNTGSGWPTGGAHVLPMDGLQTLAYGEVIVSGGRKISIPLPPPKKTFSYYFFGLLEWLLKGQLMDFIELYASPVAVFAARDLENNRSGRAWRIDDYVKLDPKSLQIIPHKFNRLNWEAPPGQWRIIAIYAMPSGENPILVAQDSPGFILDHFDAAKTISHYNYLFGKRSGLPPFFGKPVRAIFNDSFEFKTERHYWPGFIEYFLQKRGYDIRPYLPAVLYPGYDNFYLDVFQLKRRPEFILTEEDERIRYDYSQTVSDYFIEQFLQVSNHWAESNGLQSRAQAYGMEIDVIKSSGVTHIPETEQLYAGGSDMFLKIVSAGATLYNKKLVSAETAVYMDKAFMSTPQKLKSSADKLFAAGINHIVWHGTPYLKKDTLNYGGQDWHPFASPFTTGIFSSDISETSPFWNFQKEINTYVARCQYLLRKGKPVYDVLVYYPYLGFSSSFTAAKNHPEFLFNGTMPGEPSTGEGNLLGPLKNFLEFEENPRTQWLKETWELLQALEALGLTWQWVNDESLAEAKAEKGKIHIRGNSFDRLILPNTPFISLNAAKKLLKLDEKGCSINIYKNAPYKQQGFANYQQNDQSIRQVFKELEMSAVKKNKNLLLTEAEIKKHIQNPQKIYKQMRRSLSGGKELYFFFNEKNKKQSIDIETGSQVAHWIDAMSGKISKAQTDEKGKVYFTLHPLQTIFLVVGDVEDFKRKTFPEQVKEKNALPGKITIQNWTLTVNGKDVPGKNFRLKNNTLGDWRKNEKLKFCSSPGTYTAYTDLKDLLPGKIYRLELNNVFYTAEVKVNGKKAGQLVASPFQLDISSLLKKGRNQIEITVQPALRNRLIGSMRRGDKRYQWLKGKEASLMPAGLTGPVHLLIEPLPPENTL